MNKVTFYKLLKSEKLSNSISDNFKSILTKKGNDYRLTLSELDDEIYKIDGFNYFKRAENNKPITFSGAAIEIKMSGNTFKDESNEDRFEIISFTGSITNITELIKETGGDLTTVDESNLPDLYLTKISKIENNSDYFSEKTFRPFKISELREVPTDNFDIKTSQLKLENTSLINNTVGFKFTKNTTSTGDTTPIIPFNLKEYDLALIDGSKKVFILKEKDNYNIYCLNDALKEFDHIAYFLFGIKDATICFEETTEGLNGVKFTYEKNSKYGDQIIITCNNLITDGYKEKYKSITGVEYTEEAPNVS